MITIYCIYVYYCYSFMFIVIYFGPLRFLFIVFANTIFRLISNNIDILFPSHDHRLTKVCCLSRLSLISSNLFSDEFKRMRSWSVSLRWPSTSESREFCILTMAISRAFWPCSSSTSLGGGGNAELGARSIWEGKGLLIAMSLLYNCCTNLKVTNLLVMWWLPSVESFTTSGVISLVNMWGLRLLSDSTSRVFTWWRRQWLAPWRGLLV